MSEQSPPPFSGDIYYPTIRRRALALLVDCIFYLVAFVFGGYVLAQTSLPTESRVGVPLAAMMLFEPALVAFAGTTVGHALFGMRICKEADLTRLNIFQAVARFALKILFGWISLIPVSLSRRHQAIHDMLMKSLVVLKDPGGVAEAERQVERPDLMEPGYVYSSAYRRLMVIIAYAIATSVALEILAEFINHILCAGLGACSGGGVVMDPVKGIAFLCVLYWLSLRGWTGRLWGCRRKQAVEA